MLEPLELLAQDDVDVYVIARAEGLLLRLGRRPGLCAHGVRVGRTRRVPEVGMSGKKDSSVESGLLRTVPPPLAGLLSVSVALAFPFGGILVFDVFLCVFCMILEMELSGFR